MSWWTRNNVRLIQTNLREIDADLDVDALIRKLRHLSANALLINAGGIYAFYPTRLKYHYRLPSLKRDLLGEVVERAKAEGIRVIGRFDFSKAHISIFEQHPEWFFRTRDGSEANYQGHIHTCVNGYYQQEYSLQILEEVIDNYPIDGLFWNMFGYMNAGSYDGNHHGFCHCECCRNKFSDMHGLELPQGTDQEDPVYRAYKQFQWQTVREMLKSIHDFVKRKNPELAIFNYSEYGTDFFRNESNKSMGGRKLSNGRAQYSLQNRLYSASENVKWVMDTWDGALVSNASMNALGWHRFAGISEQENLTRLYQNMASGSGLDYCILGVFENFPDRSNFASVKEVFEFHRDNERYFGRLGSLSEIALIKPSGAQQYLSGSSTEYEGLFKMLKEQHIVFDVISQHGLLAKASGMERYRLILIPDIREFAAEELQLLALLQSKGVHLLATGRSFSLDDTNREALLGLFGARVESFVTERFPSYLETAEKNVFRHFPDRDWIALGESFGLTQFDAAVEKVLPYIPPASYAPPEMAYGYDRSGYCGAGIDRRRGGSGIYVPWEAGTLYYLHGYEDHKHTLFDLIDYTLGSRWSFLQTNAPCCVEIFCNRLDDGSVLLQFLNLSGYNGQTYHTPLPLYDITVTLRTSARPVRAFSLKGRQDITVADSGSGGDAIVRLNRLDLYEAIVLEAVQ